MKVKALLHDLGFQFHLAMLNYEKITNYSSNAQKVDSDISLFCLLVGKSCLRRESFSNMLYP